MPRYFFDVYDGVAMHDVQGQECADLGEARKVAARYAGDLLRDAPESLWRDGAPAGRSMMQTAPRSGAMDGA